MAELRLGDWTVVVPAGGDVSADAPAASLSVVIPYYRGASVIGDAVASVLAQTVAPSEIVICDDGSPDDLRGALGPLGQHVTIVRQDNGGISSAMNAAARNASGEYLVQLDQDDVFLPRRLEAIAAAVAARPDLDIVATDAVIEHDGRPVADLEAVNPFRSDEQRKRMLETCFFLWPAIRRSTLLDAGGYDETFAVMQDWECFLRLVLRGARVGFVREPLYRWRLTAGSRSSRDRIENVDAQVRLTEKALASGLLDGDERALAQELLASRRRWLARERVRDAVQAREGGARRVALDALRMSSAGRSTRLSAGVALLSPALARRALARRRERVDPGIRALTDRGFQPPP